MTLNTTSSPRRRAASVTLWPACEKPIALDALAVGPEPADAVQRHDLQRDARLRQPVLHALGRFPHHPRDVDLA